MRPKDGERQASRASGAGRGQKGQEVAVADARSEIQPAEG